MESNLRICQVFEQLKDLRIAQGETRRAEAYRMVIPLLKQLPYTITSGAQAKQLPGIGKSLSEKIDEILRTGTVAELELSPAQLGYDPDREAVLKLFVSIKGVGRVTAERWYNQGYRRIEDLPPDVCTNEQWIGIKLKDDLDQRIPRDEIDQVNQILTRCLAPYNIQFEIAGSYRRGRFDPGDIDIVVMAKPDLDVVSAILNCGFFTHQIAWGDKKFRGVGKIRDRYRKIDIELAQPHEYPFTLIYFTGSKNFNIKMRGHAAAMGYTLDEKGLTDPSGKSYPANSEQEVFAMLGLQYLTPAERDRY